MWFPKSQKAFQVGACYIFSCPGKFRFFLIFYDVIGGTLRLLIFFMTGYLTFLFVIDIYREAYTNVLYLNFN